MGEWKDSGTIRGENSIFKKCQSEFSRLKTLGGKKVGKKKGGEKGPEKEALREKGAAHQRDM